MPIIYKAEPAKGLCIAVWKVTEILKELETAITLTAKEHSAYSAIKNETRKREWLAVRALLQHLRPEKPVIQYKKNGKPYFNNSSENLSISHSGQYIAICLSKASYVGIDIEQIHPRIKRIAEKFINEKEKLFLKEAILIEQLCLIWCAKEVLYKIHSDGMLNFKDNLLVAPFSLSNEGQIEGIIIKNTLKTAYTLNYIKIDNYMLVYAL